MSLESEVAAGPQQACWLVLGCRHADQLLHMEHLSLDQAAFPYSFTCRVQQLPDAAAPLHLTAALFGSRVIGADCVKAVALLPQEWRQDRPADPAKRERLLLDDSDDDVCFTSAGTRLAYNAGDTGACQSNMVHGDGQGASGPPVNDNASEAPRGVRSAQGKGLRSNQADEGAHEPEHEAAMREVDPWPCSAWPSALRIVLLALAAMRYHVYVVRACDVSAGGAHQDPAHADSLSQPACGADAGRARPLAALACGARGI